MSFKKMDYLTSGIVCLSSKLKANAQALQEKRQLAGDVTKTIDDKPQCAAALAYYPQLPEITWRSTSRLIILGDGNDESTHIIGDGIVWEAERLASEVQKWLHDTKIERISLHMCFGGGNRGKAVGKDGGAFQVHPSHSFAYKFASYCSLSNSVTGRTEETNMARGTRGAEVTRIFREVGERHHGAGDKVVFIPQGGTIEHPVNPKMQWA